MTFWARKVCEALLPAAFVYAFQVAVIICFNVYAYVPYFDVPMHVLGGVAIAMGVWHVGVALQKKKYWTVRSRGLFVACIVAATLSVAVFWEWYEFIVDSFGVVDFQGTLADTMKDLFCGGIGGIITALSLTKEKGKK